MTYREEKERRLTSGGRMRVDGPAAGTEATADQILLAARAATQVQRYGASTGNSGQDLGKVEALAAKS